MTDFLGITNAITSVGGGTTTLNVINNSSVERFENEKVWIRQIVGGWEIIDWAVADVNSLTAKCDSAIAVGGTGTVSLADDGVIMTHLVRDFSLASGVQTADVDDTLQQFTFGNYPGYGGSNYNVYRYISSSSLNLTTATYRNNLKIKLSYKIVPVSATSLSDIPSSGLYLGQLSTVDGGWQTGNQYLPLFKQKATYVEESTVYTSYSSRSLSINNGTIIEANKWVDLDYTLSNNPVVNKLIAADRLGNSQSAQDGVTDTLGTPLQRFHIGLPERSGSSEPTFDIVIDLARTGLYTADGNTALWTPYKQSVV